MERAFGKLHLNIQPRDTMAGEISIEQAILLGIIVVIAVAVGWYM